MEKIVLRLSREDYQTAARIAEMGGFEGVEDYLNAVVREAIKQDAKEFRVKRE